MNTKTKQYEAARQCMIESQIHPMGVVSEPVLAAFKTVPREEFVPEHMRGFCYCDEDIEIAKDSFLIEPSVLARLLQAASPKKTDVALNIGSGMGYNCAVLAQLVSTVVDIDDSQDMLDTSQKNWDRLGYLNIAAIKSELYNGAAEHAPYDIILIGGAAAFISDEIKNQLKVGGRLVCVVKKAGQTMGKAILIERVEQDIFSERVLFDAATPYLRGFAPKKEFVF